MLIIEYMSEQEQTAQQLDPQRPEPRKVRVKVAYNDINARGNGERAVARIIYQGKGYWPEECPIAEDVGAAPPKLKPASYHLAGDRRHDQYATLPVGTLVVRYIMPIRHYKQSRAIAKLYEVTEEGLKPVEKGKVVRSASGDYVLYEGQKMYL